MCPREGRQSEANGFVVTPSHGKVSIVKSLRIYTHNNCPSCDPVDYIVEGRVDSSSQWIVIAQGDFAWKDASLGRNSRGISIQSNYDLGDETLNFEEVPFSNNRQAFLEYKVTFPTTRAVDSSYLYLAELELPGILYDMMPGTTGVPTPQVSDI